MACPPTLEGPASRSDKRLRLVPMEASTSRGRRGRIPSLDNPRGRSQILENVARREIELLPFSHHFLEHLHALEIFLYGPLGFRLVPTNQRNGKFRFLCRGRGQDISLAVNEKIAVRKPHDRGRHTLGDIYADAVWQDSRNSRRLYKRHFLDLCLDLGQIGVPDTRFFGRACHDP